MTLEDKSPPKPLEEQRAEQPAPKSWKSKDKSQLVEHKAQQVQEGLSDVMALFRDAFDGGLCRSDCPIPISTLGARGSQWLSCQLQTSTLGAWALFLPTLGGKPVGMAASACAGSVE